MVTSDANLVMNRINGKLLDYQKIYQRLTIPEVIEKKGTDVRIQAWRLFYENKFGGKGKKKEGIAFAELKRRSKAGLGTFVRDTELQSRWGAPPSVTNGRKRKGQPLTRWQKLVWQESARRDSGVGVLAVGLLSKQFQKGFKGPTLPLKRFNTESKAFGKMVEISLETHVNGASYTIEGFTPFMGDLAAKHNIGPRALGEMERDLDVYLSRKFAEAKQKAFGGI